MCTETGIKDVYRGVQGACPWRAVTHAGGTAERSERRAVGMGLKLVESSACEHEERIQRASDDVRFPRCGNCKLLEKIDTRHWEGFNLRPRGICRQGVERLDGHSTKSFACSIHFATNMSKFLVFRKW